MMFIKKSLFILIVVISILSCQTTKNRIADTPSVELTIAFGSCNNQRLENHLWKEIVKHKPAVWIWGGDNTYSDTDDMNKLKNDYRIVLNHPDYTILRKSAKILGTWDDHDYGLNDGGADFKAKKESQQVFLDFMGVSKNSKRRSQEGIYHSDIIDTKQGSVKVIVLDTRYFRSDLTKSTDPKKRYQPNKYGDGTMLGAQQWAWLERELAESKADFNVIMSSVQVLSDKHGYETWGNMPHEVDKLKKIIQTSKAKGVLILSGDRHISEFSKTRIEGMSYPLIDFTNSGLTHAFDKFEQEENPYRVGEVVPRISFGLLIFNFKNRETTMQIRGKGDELLGELKQQY